MRRQARLDLRGLEDKSLRFRGLLVKALAGAGHYLFEFVTVGGRPEVKLRTPIFKQAYIGTRGNRGTIRQHPRMGLPGGSRFLCVGVIQRIPQFAGSGELGRLR